jgi:hypothetical protein
MIVPDCNGQVCTPQCLTKGTIGVMLDVKPTILGLNVRKKEEKEVQ